MGRAKAEQMNTLRRSTGRASQGERKAKETSKQVLYSEVYCVCIVQCILTVLYLVFSAQTNTSYSVS